MKVGDYVKIRSDLFDGDYYHTDIMKIIGIDELNPYFISVDYNWEREAEDGSTNVIHISKLIIDDECRILKSRKQKFKRILDESR